MTALGFICPQLVDRTVMQYENSSINTVVLEIGLTDTLFVTLFWPHREGLSAGQILSGPHQIDGHRKKALSMVLYPVM